MVDYEKHFRMYCEENSLPINLSFDMPEGYETANGTFDPTVNTLFINKDMLQSQGIYEDKEVRAYIKVARQKGATLARLHQLSVRAEMVKDRRYFHAPPDKLLKILGLEECKGYFANPPKGAVQCFCHGDFHYAKTGKRKNMTVRHNLICRGASKFCLGALFCFQVSASLHISNLRGLRIHYIHEEERSARSVTVI